MRVDEELAYWVEKHPLGKNVLIERALRDLKKKMAVEDRVREKVEAELAATRPEIEARVRAEVEAEPDEPEPDDA